MSRLAARENLRRRRRNLQLLWVSQFVNTAGLMMLVPVMPLHMESLGAPEGSVGFWAGFAVAAPALPLALTTPVWGRLGDRVGRRWMVVRALVGLAVAMLVMAVAQTPWMFIAGRLLQGCVGGVVEAAAAFVGSDDRDEGRGAALGRSFGATAAGALAGPLLGGSLVGGSALRVVMLAIAAAALALAVLCAVGLRERRAPDGPREAARSSRPPRRASAVGAIGGPILVAAFLVYFGVYGLIPVYAEHVQALVSLPGQAGPWIGGLHAVMWGGTLLGSSWWGRYNDRQQTPVRTFVLVSFVTATGILLQAWPPHPAVLVPFRLVQGFCFAAIAQSVFLHASRSAPTAARKAEHVGTSNSFLLAGQFAGPLAFGTALGSLSPVAGVLLTGATVGLAGACGLVAWRGRRELARPGDVPGTAVREVRRRHMRATRRTRTVRDRPTAHGRRTRVMRSDNRSRHRSASALR